TRRSSVAASECKDIADTTATMAATTAKLPNSFARTRMFFTFIPEPPCDAFNEQCRLSGLRLISGGGPLAGPDSPFSAGNAPGTGLGSRGFHGTRHGIGVRESAAPKWAKGERGDAPGWGAAAARAW